MKTYDDNCMYLSAYLHVCKKMYPFWESEQTVGVKNQFT